MSNLLPPFTNTRKYDFCPIYGHTHECSSHELQLFSVKQQKNLSYYLLLLLLLFLLGYRYFMSLSWINALNTPKLSKTFNIHSLWTYNNWMHAHLQHFVVCHFCNFHKIIIIYTMHNIFAFYTLHNGLNGIHKCKRSQNFWFCIVDCFDWIFWIIWF